MLTIVVLMASIAGVRPCDLSRGSPSDGVNGRPLLLQAICLGVIDVMHLGSPCQSFARARILPLRSRYFPTGLFDLLRTWATMVESGNELAESSASQYMLCVVSSFGVHLVGKILRSVDLVSSSDS